MYTSTVLVLLCWLGHRSVYTKRSYCIMYIIILYLNASINMRIIYDLVSIYFTWRIWYIKKQKNKKIINHNGYNRSGLHIVQLLSRLQPTLYSVYILYYYHILLSYIIILFKTWCERPYILMKYENRQTRIVF